jgi:2,4-dienoyl-CoA reductase-like NADH-dependent reductase (Old Yellow Enzyme family)
MSSRLFEPLQIRGLTLPNRIVVAPMCQYSADDGSATDWHVAHLTQLALGGAGLVVIEATGVSAQGRISPKCLGLYSDRNEEALARAIAAAKRYGNTSIGIQLAHAGRKASTYVPWEGAGALKPGDGAWQTIAPSAVPFAKDWHTPKALDSAGLDRVRGEFVTAAKRAVRLGLDSIELHMAHGYLMQQFLSPLSNRREDEYGGSLENRMRFPLQVFAAVRAVLPAETPLGVRINGTDWVEGGWAIEDAVVFSAKLKTMGCDFVCVSSGGTAAPLNMSIGPGYQVPFARRVRREAGMLTRAVGMILNPEQAEAILVEGDADMVALARGVLDDPRWAWHAAKLLGADASYPPQYRRAKFDVWPISSGGR